MKPFKTAHRTNTRHIALNKAYRYLRTVAYIQISASCV